MGALASLEQREEVRRSVKALLAAGRLVFGDPEHVEVVGADAERGAFISPLLLRCDDASRPNRTRSRRSARSHDHRLPRHRRGDRAGGARPGQPGRLGRHRRRGVRPRGRARPGALARPAAGARPRRRRRVDRARLAAAAAGARRPRTGRRRRGDGRHPRRAAPHAAHRGAGQPAGAGRGHRPLGARRRAGHRPAATRSASPWPSCGSATPWSPARARSRWPTSSTSPSSPATPSTRTWTRRPRRANPFFDGRVAHGYLIVSFAAGLFVQPDPGPVLANYGLENLRFLTPVYPGDELTVTLTCKQIIPREDADARRGALGRRRHQPGRQVGRHLRRPHAGRQAVAAARRSVRMPDRGPDPHPEAMPDPVRTRIPNTAARGPATARPGLGRGLPRSGGPGPRRRGRRRGCRGRP